MNAMNWKISILRWLAWVLLSIGMVFGLFVIQGTGSAVISRSLAQQALNRQQVGELINIEQLSSWADVDFILMMFVVAIATIALVVALDYYLRAGERNGRLLRRIGLAVAIEAGVYLLALLIRFFVTTF